ncbi:MAG: sensor domain-containing diguanylate cyclase [Pseudomonadota bacterium]
MISRFIPLPIRLTFAFALLAANTVWVGLFLGLLPSEHELELRERAKIAEVVAIQIANNLNTTNVETTQRLMNQIVQRTPQLGSMAIRQTAGTVFAAAGDHEGLWKKSFGSERHLSVKLQNKTAEWGNLELVFMSGSAPNWIPGIPNAHTKFAGIAFLVLFALFYWFVRRILIEVDPKKVVPPRIQKAYDTMSEGVLLLDKSGVVLLCNQAFTKLSDVPTAEIVGKPASLLSWIIDKDTALPWENVMLTGQPVTGHRLHYLDGSGNTVSLLANVSAIETETGEPSGVLVTLDNVTELEATNQKLSLALDELKFSQDTLLERNKELEYAASYDALSKCLNRRALFARFEQAFRHASEQNMHLGCVMVDLDHFKTVNDRFGHAVGDRVIEGAASVLREHCGQDDFVGRYGGEEFCVVLSCRTEQACFELAETIRRKIVETSPAWFPSGEQATASIGLAMRVGQYSQNACDELVDRADQALYRAKETGRNRVVAWSQMAPGTMEPSSAAV